MCGVRLRVIANPMSIGEEAISANAIAGKTGAERPSSRLMPRRPVRYINLTASRHTAAPPTLSMLSAT